MANIYLDCSEGLKKTQLTAFERLLRQVKSFTSAMLMDAGISVITWHFHVPFCIPVWSRASAHMTQTGKLHSLLWHLVSK